MADPITDLLQRFLDHAVAEDVKGVDLSFDNLRKTYFGDTETRKIPLNGNPTTIGDALDLIAQQIKTARIPLAQKQALDRLEQLLLKEVGA